MLHLILHQYNLLEAKAITVAQSYVVRESDCRFRYFSWYQQHPHELSSLGIIVISKFVTSLILLDILCTFLLKKFFLTLDTSLDS